MGSLQLNKAKKKAHSRCQQAIQAGVRISVQGLDQRMDEQGLVFMKRLLEEGMSQRVQSEEKWVVLEKFKRGYLTDCTRLVWLKRA